MNILIITSKFHGSGGTETFVRNMSRGFIKKGHGVTIISHQKFYEKKTPLSAKSFNLYYTFPSFHIPAIPMSYVPIYIVGKIFKISTITDKKFDIVSAQGELEGFCALRVKSLLKCPITLRIAGIWNIIALKENLKIYGSNWITRAASSIAEIIEKNALNSSDAITTINEQQRNIIIEKYNVQPKKVQVIPHGIDTNLFSPDVISQYRDSMRNNYNLKGPVILCVCRLAPIKRIDILLRALAMLVRDFPNVSLVLIGPSSYMNIDYYRTLAKSLGVEKNLVYIGEVPHKEVAKYMAICDVYADVSQEFGIGFSTLEAMSCGLPVVSTRAEVGILKVNQTVQSITAGLLAVLNDRKRARMLGEKARIRIVKTHDYKVIVERYIKFFKDIQSRKKE